MPQGVTTLDKLQLDLSDSQEAGGQRHTQPGAAIRSYWISVGRAFKEMRSLGTTESFAMDIEQCSSQPL